MFQKNIAEEEHHNHKSNKHNPTSGYVEIEQVRNKDKIENGMEQNAEDA